MNAEDNAENNAQIATSNEVKDLRVQVASLTGRVTFLQEALERITARKIFQDEDAEGYSS